MDGVRVGRASSGALRCVSGHDGAGDGDAALLRRVAASDRDAMRVLFSRHHLAVFRFVLQRLRNRKLAEDVTGAVFLDVWRQAGRFDSRCGVLTWILLAARDKTAAVRRKADPRVEGDSARVAGKTNGPDALAPSRDRAAALHRCMDQLPDEHREVMDLVYCQEQSPDSVAAILGIPRSAVSGRVFHARRRLADEMKKSGVVGREAI